MKVIIIGNGIAGITCAGELRKRESDPSRLQIEVYGREAFHYYARIKLPELLEAGDDAESILLHDSAWYSSRGIDVFLGDEAVEIDRRSHTVVFSSGHVAHYDKLVLALGSRSVRPTISGNDLAGTFVLREMNDGRRLASHVRRATDAAVVLGGGLLGLEAAKHLVNAGVKRVEVVEFFERLLPRQLDSAGAALLERHIAESGISVRLSSSAKAVLGSKRVEGVAFRDGSAVNTPTVLFSIGVRSRVELAERAGLSIGKGVIVDDRLTTSDPDIYAVGDVAEFEGLVWGNLVAALEQAPVAAAQILGDESRAYKQTIPRSTLKVAGLDLTSLGSVQDDVPGKAYTRTSADLTRYEKYVVAEDGTLSGAILIGSKSRARSLPARMGKPIEVTELDEWLSF
jgi:nitrite reductase (NADH) large subunit